MKYLGFIYNLFDKIFLRWLQHNIWMKNGWQACKLKLCRKHIHFCLAAMIWKCSWKKKELAKINWLYVCCINGIKVLPDRIPRSHQGDFIHFPQYGDGWLKGIPMISFDSLNWWLTEWSSHFHPIYPWTFAFFQKLTILALLGVVPIPTVYLNPANWSLMDVTTQALNLPWSPE